MRTYSRTLRLCFFLSGYIFASSLAQAQQPFDLDTAFRTTINSWYVTSLLPLNDGKVIVSGQIKFADDGPISFRGGARLNADGTMDPSFAYPAPMNGKMIAWEDRLYGTSGDIVRRITLDGDVDPTFIMMNNGPYFASLQGGDYHVYPDGRILMSGVHRLEDTLRGFEGYYCLIWFSNTGYLDTTKTHRTCAGSLNTFTELPNGQFIGSGSTGIWDGQQASNIIRFNADGALDTTFQANVYWGQAYGFLPLPDGRVYAGGAFKIDGIPDTLRLVRFMPDGTLDPTFNNLIDLHAINLSGSVRGVVSGIYALDEGRLIVSGGFEVVEGESRQGICLIDTAGNLLDDHFWGPGCSEYVYQGWTHGSVRGITPAPDGNFYIWGSYHGYDDGTTNDTTQRFVSRLYGLDVGITEPKAAELTLYPNPGNDVLTIDHPNFTKTSNVQICDALGREVLRTQLQRTHAQLHVGYLPSGIYGVRVTDGKTVYFVKWVRE